MFFFVHIPVRSSLPQTCIPGQNIELEGPSGYLASSDILNHRYGGDCPWHITAPPGQRINITLYNFARYRLSDSTNHYLSDGACYELGDILERGGQSQRLTLCKKHRKTHVYTSQTNSVNIQVKTDSALADYYFLLKYEGRIYKQHDTSIYTRIITLYVCLNMAPITCYSRVFIAGHLE